MRGYLYEIGDLKQLCHGKALPSMSDDFENFVIGALYTLECNSLKRLSWLEAMYWFYNFGERTCSLLNFLSLVFFVCTLE